MKSELVLLHGWGIDSRIWQPLLPTLDQTFNVTCLDLPGYGTSSSQTSPENIDQLADHALRHAPPTAIWCGWSLGGMVAIAAAHRHPGRIKQLNLVSTTPRFMMGPDWEHGTSKQALDQLSDLFAADYQTGLSRFLVNVLYPSSGAKRRAREIGNDLQQSVRPADATLQHGLSILRNTDLRNSLAELACPVHILTGETDHVISPESSRYMAHVIPASTLTQLGTSHAPFANEPGRFVAWLNQTASQDLLHDTDEDNG